VLKELKTDSVFRERPYLIGNLGTKQPASTPWADSPGVYVLWIGPDKITKCSLVRDFLIAFNGAYLVQSFDVRWKATMYTKDLLIYQLWEKSKHHNKYSRRKIHVKQSFKQL